MRTIPTRQRVTLARRIAAGLPVWAAAKVWGDKQFAKGRILKYRLINELVKAVGQTVCKKVMDWGVYGTFRQCEVKASELCHIAKSEIISMI